MIDALTTIGNLDELLPAVLRIVAQAFKTDNCAFYEHNDDTAIYLRYWLLGDRVLHPEELVTLDRESFATVRRLAEGFTVPDTHLGSHFRRRTKASILDHTRGQSVPEFHQFACRNGWAMELNVPLVVDGYADGALVIYRPAGATYTPAEIDLAEALGKQLALAMQISYLAAGGKAQAVVAALAREQEKAAQQRATDLARVNAVLSDSLGRLSQQSDPEVFLAHVVGEIVNQMGAANAMLVRIEDDRQTAQLHLFHDGRQPRWGLSGEEIALFAAPFKTDVTPAFKMALAAGPTAPSALGEGTIFVASRYNGPVPIEQFALPGGLEWMARISASDAAFMLLFAGDRPIGTLHLHFTNGRQLRPDDDLLFTALSQQAAIALRLSDLATRSRDAAIAHEQEAAAQKRVAELVKANASMRRSIDWLAREPDLTAFLGHVLREISRQFDADAAQIFTYSADRRTLQTLVGWIDGEITFFPPYANQILVDDWIGWSVLLETNAPRQFSLTDDAHLFLPEYLEYHHRCGHRGIVCVLLQQDDQPLGFIGFASCQRECFSETELELVQSLAQQATLAIQFKQLAEVAGQAAIAREQKKAAQGRATELTKLNQTLQAEVAERQRAEHLARRQTATLSQILNVLSRDVELDTILTHVMKVVVEQFNEHSASLWWFWDVNDAPTDYLALDYEDGIARMGAQSWHPATLDRQTGSRFWQAIKDIRTPLVMDVQTDPLLQDYREFLLNKGIQTVLNVPLFRQDKRIGTMTVRCKQLHDFQPEEIDLMLAVAQQAMLAIQLTHLAEEAKQAAILDERNRMARDIHDTLAQAFTGIVIQLEAAKSFTETQSQATQAHFTRATNLAREGLAEARRSVRALRPEALEQQDLGTALSHLVQTMTAGASIQATVRVFGWRALSPEIEANLLRIGQEALTNVLRHAQAKTVQLELRFEPTFVQLQISDDGQGFDPQQIRPDDGFGLLGIQERSQRIKADLSLISQMGAGTKITVTVPTD